MCSIAADWHTTRTCILCVNIFLLRLRAVYIYQPLYFFFLIFFFVKDRRQVIYSYFTVIAHFFKLNQQERNHPVKIYKVNFLVLTMVDCK